MRTYLVLCDFTFRGRAWCEAPEALDRADLVEMFLLGEYAWPLRVLELAEPVARHVSHEIAREVMRRAMTEDRPLSEGVQAFIGRHYKGEAA